MELENEFTLHQKNKQTKKSFLYPFGRMNTKGTLKGQTELLRVQDKPQKETVKVDKNTPNTSTPILLNNRLQKHDL